ncbi:uncharacterized protein LOC123327392 [Drosophila simulans]|uniref:uncharacterized protein LOC123327392 n=1 Tax=Drosophila simulans TaxID=7240 RepID=UPI001D10288B|nr:uncharacterized protein LOC123327392 [Drosophila simulans]
MQDQRSDALRRRLDEVLRKILGSVTENHWATRQTKHNQSSGETVRLARCSCGSQLPKNLGRSSKTGVVEQPWATLPVCQPVWNTTENKPKMEISQRARAQRT